MYTDPSFDIAAACIRNEKTLEILSSLFIFDTRFNRRKIFAHDEI